LSSDFRFNNVPKGAYISPIWAYIGTFGAYIYELGASQRTESNG
jgi:hypothetical protein